jgi:hypothetical protein
LVTIPEDWPTGEAYLIGIVDVTNAVLEVREDNNTASRLVEVEGSPDLVISNFSLNRNSPEGAEIYDVSVEIFNQGFGDTTRFTVAWWADEEDINPACDWIIEGGLAAQARQTLTCRYIGLPGKNEAINDLDNHVPDLHEQNKT